MILASVLSTTATAGPSTTLEAFERLEEVLELRIEDGLLVRDEVLPAIVVSARPLYEESAPLFGNRALEVLVSSFGDRGLRMCEACMAPRTIVENGDLVVQTGPIGLDEVVRLDDQLRGEGQASRSAIWIDEHRRGVSIRIVDLATARVLFAQNIDPSLAEVRRTRNRYRLAAELERRADDDGLTQAFFDFTIAPDQHLSLEWNDQWGRDNGNLSGFTISVLDPFIGIGGSYHRRIPLANTLIGTKVLVSLPTAFSRVFDDTGDFQLVDPLITAVGVVRVPLGRSNYGVVATASTNGNFGVGLSLMNISLLPVIP